MIEEWKTIEGTNDQYQVSNLGRFKSISNGKNRREKILAHNFGRLRFSIRKEGNAGWKDNRKEFTAKELVMEYFGLPRPSPEAKVRLIDKSIPNFGIANLCWFDPSEIVKSKNTFAEKVRGHSAIKAFEELANELGITPKSLYAKINRAKLWSDRNV